MRAGYDKRAAQNNRRRTGRLLFFWIILTLVGMGFSASFYISRAPTAQPITFLTALIYYQLRFQMWAAFSPLIVWIDERFRSASRHWSKVLALHFLTSIALSMANTLFYGIAYWSLDWMTNLPAGSLTRFYSALWANNFVMGIVTYKLILTTNYAFDYYEKFWEEKHRSNVLEAQLAQAQLQALKMQLQPHFLFNTLNSISSLVLEDARAAVHMIARLGDFLRITIESDGAQQVSLGRELEFLKCYLEIEQTRFRDRLKVSIDVDAQALAASVPNLILQPIVENAIRHGIAPRAAAGRIEIHACRRGERLRVQVSDDGPGLSVKGNSAHRLKEGLGLSNTRARLGQLYGDDFRLDLANAEGGGTVVTVDVPYRIADDEDGERDVRGEER